MKNENRESTISAVIAYKFIQLNELGKADEMLKSPHARLILADLIRQKPSDAELTDTIITAYNLDSNISSP